jgi:2,5-furandicarboxylate decarboxylase 1
MNLKEYVSLLEEKGLLVRIEKEADPRFEIPTIMKMMDGRPLLFENVKGHEMPVVANICSTREMVALGLGVGQDQIIPTMMKAIESPVEPEVEEAQGYAEVEPDLSKLPILTYYPFDGGPYVASGIAIASDQEYGTNASYHRGMVITNDTFVYRILQRDFDKYIERGLTEFAFCIGNTIPVLLGAAISEATGIHELAIANAMYRTPLIELAGHHVPGSEIVLIMEFTGETHAEGPFLDLTETPDIVRDQRVARVKKMFVREDSLFHGLLPGGLEHKVLMGMPREPSIYREVSKVCDVKDVLVTPGGASWLHGAVSIRKKGEDDGKKAIEAAFAGHKSMKHVFIVDDDIDIHKPEEIEWAMATRFQGDRDLIVKREKGSSLDPSSDLETRMTTKMGFDLTIPWGKDPKDFRRPELPLKLNIEDYVGGSC